jgi:hypothetical protein
MIFCVLLNDVAHSDLLMCLNMLYFSVKTSMELFLKSSRKSKSSDIIPIYCYASSWQVMPWPAGETGRSRRLRRRELRF